MKKLVVLSMVLSVGLCVLDAPLAHARGGHEDPADHDQTDDHGNRGGSNNGGNTGRGNTQVRVRLKLSPTETTPADLAGASGNVDARTKNGKSEFKATVKVPFVASSLGITDDATAKAADVHLEFKRADAVIADCTLKANIRKDDSDESEEDTPVNRQFNVLIQKASKKKGVHNVKGTCGGTIPVLAKGDSATAYANVGGARVDFLSSPVVATPTPTPTPTATPGV